MAKPMLMTQCMQLKRNTLFQSTQRTQFIHRWVCCHSRCNRQNHFAIEICMRQRHIIYTSAQMHITQIGSDIKFAWRWMLLQYNKSNKWNAIRLAVWNVTLIICFLGFVTCMRVLKSKCCGYFSDFFFILSLAPLHTFIQHTHFALQTNSNTSNAAIRSSCSFKILIINSVYASIEPHNESTHNFTKNSPNGENSKKEINTLKNMCKETAKSVCIHIAHVGLLLCNCENWIDVVMQLKHALMLID